MLDTVLEFLPDNFRRIFTREIRKTFEFRPRMKRRRGHRTNWLYFACWVVFAAVFCLLALSCLLAASRPGLPASTFAEGLAGFAALMFCAKYYRVQAHIERYG